MKRISILLYIVQGNFSVHINILYILSIRVTKTAFILGVGCKISV